MDENRRQEAIEKTAEYICGRTHPGLSPPCPFCTDTAEHLHEYILAPLREFPEELEDMLGELYDATLDDYATRQWVKHWINKFKRLWQGQETLMEPEPLIDHRPFKGAKGGCPRCKGSGKISWEFPKHDPEGSIDCPDCKGTGERRKGEQRKGLEVGDWLFLEQEPTKGIFRELHQKRWFIDNRIGEDRRK